MSRGDETLLTVRDLRVRFQLKAASLFAPKRYLHAVDGVSFSIARGQTMAIVGESGSGKTTTALAVARLIEAHAGSVNLQELDILDLDREALRAARRRFQFIFQDPYSSLNPRLRAADIVAEPLPPMAAEARQKIIDDLFEAVGLRPEQQRLFPHQFSGGQRQRIGIARAMAPKPDLIICDEPVSALDVAVQAQVLNLLRVLQRERGLTYLFISHDLGVVQHMCDQIAVMYLGKIVEYADRLSLFKTPCTLTPEPCCRRCHGSIRRPAAATGACCCRAILPTPPSRPGDVVSPPVARSPRRAVTTNRRPCAPCPTTNKWPAIW